MIPENIEIRAARPEEEDAALSLVHTPPGPELPDDIIQKTSEKYIEAYTQVTGLEF